MPELRDDDLALALELADLADGITLSRYRAADLQVETKPDLTPVTEADRAVELALRERIGQRRPADGVVGEEFGEAPGEAPGEEFRANPRVERGGAGEAGAPGGARGRRWIIDPIDGTMSYVRGLPTWSTLIALADGDEVVTGVVSMPALGRRWWAQRGAGAFADGRPIRVSTVSDLRDAQLLWSGVREWDAIGRLDDLLALARACWRTRGIGDAWQYVLVAEGVAEVALDPKVSLWDLAAVSLIVEEAGGAFTDLSGAPTPAGGSGIATNGLVHEAALRFVGSGRD